MRETLEAVRTVPARARRWLSPLLENPAVRNLLLCLAGLASGFLLSGGGVAGTAMPYAVCLIAVAGTVLRSFSVMLGSAAGYLWFWGLQGGLEYVAVGVLVFAAVCIAGSGELSAAEWFLPVLTVSLSAMVGVLFLVQARFAPVAVASYILRLGAAGLLTWIFSGGVKRHAPGALLCGLFCLLSGCSAIGLGFGVTLGQVLAVALGAASAASPLGILLCAVGGLAVDLAAMPPVSLTAVLCCAGILSHWSPFRFRGARLVIFLTAVVAAVFFTGGQMPELVPAAALGCCVAIVLPESLFYDRTRRNAVGIQQRLERAAAVFSEIHTVLAARNAASTAPDAATVFDRASDRVCGSCVLWNQCWKQRSTDTYRALCAVARPMLERGAAVRDDFPRGFADQCCHLDALTGAINRELEGLLSRRQYETRLRESRTVLAEQYAFLGDFLERTAREPEAREEAPVSFRPELGISMAGRDGHAISGDRGACFRTEDGMYYLLLCDGMGSGEEAAAEGTAAIRTVAGLIRAGLEPRSALETLNGVYILRGDGGFATVDLLAVSLVTGEGMLYKWGAAPSYLKTAAGVQKIGTATPPPGFGVGESQKPAEYRLSLRQGEMLVLLSDGAGGEDTGRQIAQWEDGDPKALSAALVAKDRQDGEDDRTALALCLRPCMVLT